MNSRIRARDQRGKEGRKGMGAEGSRTGQNIHETESPKGRLPVLLFPSA